MLFFGSAIVFAAVHRLTQHSSSAVMVLAQFATLGLIVGALALYVRSREGKDGEDDG